MGHITELFKSALPKNQNREPTTDDLDESVKKLYQAYDKGNISYVCWVIEGALQSGSEYQRQKLLYFFGEGWRFLPAPATEIYEEIIYKFSFPQGYMSETGDMEKGWEYDGLYNSKLLDFLFENDKDLNNVARELDIYKKFSQLRSEQIVPKLGERYGRFTLRVSPNNRMTTEVYGTNSYEQEVLEFYLKYVNADPDDTSRDYANRSKVVQARENIVTVAVGNIEGIDPSLKKNEKIFIFFNRQDIPESVMRSILWSIKDYSSTHSRSIFATLREIFKAYGGTGEDNRTLQMLDSV